MTPRPRRSEVERCQEIDRLAAEQLVDDQGHYVCGEDDEEEISADPVPWPPLLRTGIGPTRDADDFREESFP